MSKKILVVDDEEDVRHIVRIIFEAEGYTVSIATNGTEAFEQAVQTPPDMIVSDVMMPGMDGFELLEKLKAEPTTHEIPVVLLTACASDEQVARGWKTGADLYLRKPFTADQLRTFALMTFAE